MQILETMTIMEVIMPLIYLIMSHCPNLIQVSNNKKKDNKNNTTKNNNNNNNND